MLVFHCALKCSIQAFERVIVQCFLTRSDRSGVWNCFPTVLYYYADIQGAKTLRKKQGLIDPGACHRCMITLEDLEKMKNSNRHHFLGICSRRASKIENKDKLVGGSRRLAQISSTL